jgi:hypothetical protein
MRRGLTTPKDTCAHRPVTGVAAVYESLAKLDNSVATVAAFRTLALRIATAPEDGPTLSRKSIRVVRTEGYGPFLPLRVFYWMDEDTVYLLDVHVYIYEDAPPSS